MRTALRALKVIIAATALAYLVLAPLNGSSEGAFTKKGRRSANMSTQDSSNQMPSSRKLEQFPAYRIAEALKQQLREFGAEEPRRKEMRR